MEPLVGIVSSDGQGDEKAGKLAYILRGVGYPTLLIKSKKFESSSFNGQMSVCKAVIVVGCKQTKEKNKDLSRVLSGKWTLFIECDEGVLDKVTQGKEEVDICLVYSKLKETQCNNCVACSRKVIFVEDEEDENKKVIQIINIMTSNKKPNGPGLLK